MRLKTILLSASMLGGAVAAAQAEPNVVVSIKPVHSLVAAVMQDVGTPELIVEGAGSPHTYALKPSQAANLEQADIVFWVGPGLENFLEKPIETIAANAKSVELSEAPGLIKLDFREGGAFEKHDHGDDEHHDDHAGHDHGDHDDHDHAKEAAHHDDHDHDDHDHAKADDHHDHDHDDHDHAKEADHHDDHDHDDHDHAKAEGHHDDHDDHDHAKEAGHHDDHDHDDHDHAKAEDHHDGHDHHAHGAFDLHIWLDPANAKVMVGEIEAALSAADPDNSAKYKENAAAMNAKLDGLTTEITEILEPVGDKGYIVFHDAYQYFENRFGVTATGSITVSPEVIPGVERIREIQAKIEDLGTTCVFSEPQFEPKLVVTVTEGTDAASGVIDPLGATLEDGPDLYPTLLRNIATSMRDCLS